MSELEALDIGLQKYELTNLKEIKSSYGAFSSKWSAGFAQRLKTFG